MCERVGLRGQSKLFLPISIAGYISLKSVSYLKPKVERGGMMQQGLQCGGGSGGERRFDAARQPFVPLYRCRSAAF